MNDPLPAHAAAIQPDVAGAKTGWKRIVIKKVFVKAGNLESKLAFLAVPIKREQTGHGLLSSHHVREGFWRMCVSGVRCVGSEINQN
jgi:hypothetical protein